MLRRATEGDADEIAAVFRRSFGTLTFLPTVHTPEEDRRFFGGVVAAQEVWVADEEGRILGFSALSEDMLNHIYVEPSDQGRRVGSALLARVKERRPGGFSLWVFQRNEGARRFYERHGLRLVRLTDGSGNEEQEPDALYEWRP
jgi:GNAT superfamily N-acetyltransferase